MNRNKFFSLIGLSFISTVFLSALTTNFFFPKNIENEVYQSPLYPKGANPLSVLEDYELKVDKDTTRHDTLVMPIIKDKKDRLIATYTIAII